MLLSGNTQGAVPLALVGISATHSGVYVADATVAVSDGAVGGSLRISGTYLHSASLALVRSDRRLAQLPLPLRDVNAMFTVRGDLIGVEVTGLKKSHLSWTLHLNVKVPLPRRKNSE